MCWVNCSNKKIIMKNIILKAITFFVIFNITSCKKQDTYITSNHLFETKPLNYIEIKNIATSIESLKTTASINNRYKNNDITEIHKLINPLIDNGKKIHNEILNNLIKSSEWESISKQEKEILLNFDDIQFSELSLIYFDLQEKINLREDDTWTTVRSCLSGALGLGDLYYLLIENPRSLATARGTISLLKHIGGRYLGYIGLGLAIIDFADCISR